MAKLLMVDWICPWCGHQQQTMDSHPLKVECQSPTCMFKGYAHQTQHTFWAPSMLELRAFLLKRARRNDEESRRFRQAGDFETAELFEGRGSRIRIQAI